MFSSNSFDDSQPTKNGAMLSTEQDNPSNIKISGTSDRTDGFLNVKNIATKSSTLSDNIRLSATATTFPVANSMSDFLEQLSFRIMGSGSLSFRHTSTLANTRTTRTSSRDGTARVYGSSNGFSFHFEHSKTETLGQMFDTNFLGFLPPDHKYRLMLYKMLKSRQANIFFNFLALIQFIVYITQTWPKSIRTDYAFGQNWQDYVLLVIFLIYTIEFICNAVTFGLFSIYYTKDRRRNSKMLPYYWHRFSNVIDSLGIFCFWIYFFSSTAGFYEYRIFQAISTLRTLRLLYVTDGLRSISRSITESGDLLKNVMVFFVFFIFFFAIMGIQFFSGSLSRRCVLNITQTDGSSSLSSVDPTRACGSFIDSDGIIRSTIDSSSAPKGYTCPMGQYCMFVNTFSEQPTGFLSFDYILISMYTLFVEASEQGWVDIMYLTMDAENISAAFYHIIIIIIIDLILINLLVAVISATFSSIRADYKEKLKKEIISKRVLQDNDETWTITTDESNFYLRQKYVEFFLKIKKSRWFNASLFICGVFSIANLLLEKQYSYNNAVTRTVGISLWCFFLFELSMNWVIFRAHRKFFVLSRVLDLVNLVVTFLMLLPGIYGTFVYQYLSIFQILRIYKIIHMVPRIPIVLKIAFGNIVDLADAFIFFTLMISIFATIGMQMYGGRLHFLDSSSPTMNYDSFPEAFLTMFEIMVSDNWTKVLYSSIISTNFEMFSAIYTGIFYIIIFIMSHSVIVSLAVAVTLENFELDDNEKYYGQLFQLLKKDEMKTLKAEGRISKWNPHRFFKPAPELIRLRNLPLDLQPKIRAARFRDFIRNEVSYSGAEKNILSDKIKDNTRGGFNKIFLRILTWLRPKADNSDFQGSTDSLNYVDTTNLNDLGLFASNEIQESNEYGHNVNLDKLNPVFEEVKQTNSNLKTEKGFSFQEFKELHPYYDTSYFIFKPDNPIRKLCQRIFKRRKGFDLYRFILIISVIGSTCILAIDTPLSRKQNLFNALQEYASSVNSTVESLNVTNPDENVIDLLQRSEYLSDVFYIGESLFLAIFSFDFVIHTIADGVFFTPNAYLTSPFNWLDTLVLLSMWLNLTFQTLGSTGIHRFLRMIRALRPLRIIPLIDELKGIFNIVIASLPQAIDLMMLSLFFMIAYASYGVMIFSGTFYACNDNSVNSREECIGIFTSDDGIIMPRVWQNADFHFDDIFSAMLSLFTMIFQEGWADILYTGMSTLGDDLQPQWPPKAWYNAFYFLGWMLLGFVLLRNLFVGVILQTFMTRNGIALLTSEQRKFVELQRQLKLLKPSKKAERPKEGYYDQLCFDIMMDKKHWFHKVTLGTLILNILAAASDYQYYESVTAGYLIVRPINDSFFKVKESLYIVICLIYLLEFIVRIKGLGLKKWNQNRWNFLDLLVLIGLFPTVLLRISVPSNFIDSNLLLQMQKFFLDLSILKLVRRVPILNMLFKTVAASFGSIASIFAVLVLVFLVYALIAVETFGLTKFGSVTSTYANFRGPGTAILTLFRMTTGEMWNELMIDNILQDPYCVTNDYTYLLTDCGSFAWALSIFMSFQVLVALILTNLFVATAIDHFDLSTQEKATYAILPRDDMKKFKQLWSEFDPKATGFISKDSLSKFLHRLSGRLSVRIYDEDFSVKNILLNSITRVTLSKKKFKDEQKRRSTIKSSIRKIDNYSFDKWGFNLVDLNQHLSTMNLAEVRQRRFLFNFVYQEAISTEEPDKGIPFSKLLKILAYRLIDIEQSLKLEQLLQRHHEVEIVREKVYKDKLMCTIKTLALRKRFLKLLKKSEENGSNLDLEVVSEVAKTSSKPAIPTIIVNSETTDSRFGALASSPTIDSIAGVSRVSWKEILSPNFGMKQKVKSDIDTDSEDDDTRIGKLRNSLWQKKLNHKG